MIKSLDEKLTTESRDVSRDTYISFKFPLAIQDKKRTDIKLVQPSGESCIFDSPALHHSSLGCNNQGQHSKMLNPKALKFKDAAAVVETNSTAAATAPEWPKDQPMTLFKNRDERYHHHHLYKKLHSLGFCSAASDYFGLVSQELFNQ